MKKKKYKFLLLVFFALCFLSTQLYAQQKKLVCKEYKINTTAQFKALQFEKNNYSKTASQHYLIRVYFHIVEYNDGSGPGATAADVDNEFANMQSDYAPGNICFLKAGLQYIRNSALDTATDDGSIPAMLSSYNIPNCINIYYLNYIKGSNGNCDCGIGGDAFNIPNTFCIVAKDNLGTSHTTSHETGHCLGLLHTFDYYNGYEDIDGSNSTTAGDLIQDTHADPYAHAKEPCFSVSGNIYNGTCTDPKGQTHFSPPYTNMMAYWWAYGGYPNLAFTSDQFVRINSYLNTTSDLINCESPSTYTLGPNVHYQSNYFMSSAVTTYTTTGSVIFDGLVVAGIGGQLVDLKPGFDANAYAGADISIEASNCNYTGKSVNNNNAIAEIKNSTANNLIAYPNPTSSIVHLDITTDKDEYNIVLQVFNIEMQKVEEIKLGDLIKGKHNVIFDLSKQASGLYYILIQLQNRKLSAKVSLLK